MKRLRILTFCSILLALAVFFFKKGNPTTIKAGEGLVIKNEWLVQNKNPITAKNDCRPTDQTFLTFPEWYLVFSPEEQANYFKQYTATTFPFASHVSQIWESYNIVDDQIEDKFPTNRGYHFMIGVIGSSASVEYSVKAWYETIVGRLTDTYEVKTDEDKFNAKFSRDYVDFIKDMPWYQFDFRSRICSLWSSTSFFNNYFLRKIERKYMLTSELAVKYIYGKLIGLGTKTVYDEALPTTVVAINDTTFLTLPRYDKFNKAIVDIAKEGNHFIEIAGNNSAILLTVLVSLNNTSQFENAQIVFTQPIVSNLNLKRIALATPVSQLYKLLKKLDHEKIQIEHIFDY